MISYITHLLYYIKFLALKLFETGDI